MRFRKSAVGVSRFLAIGTASFGILVGVEAARADQGAQTVTPIGDAVQQTQQGTINQGSGNQGFGNQGFGNQGFGNQGTINQGFGNTFSPLNTGGFPQSRFPTGGTNLTPNSPFSNLSNASNPNARNRSAAPFGGNARTNRASSARTSRGAATGAGGGANPTDAPARSRLQSRSTRPGGASGRSSLILDAAAVKLPSLAASPLIQTDTLYFAPAEYAVTAGQKFSTPLVFYNPNDRLVTGIDIWIRFQAERVRPAWIEAHAIESNLVGGLTREVWAEQGYIRLKADYGTPRGELIQPIATIVWQSAEGLAAPTQIRLEAPAGMECAVYEGEMNCLNLSGFGNRGVVSAQVRVVAREAAAMFEEQMPLKIVAEGEDPLLPVARDTHGVHLALLAAEEAVAPGRVSIVDVAMINPDLAEFDELRFRIRYDPSAIEILDADEDNYIAQGINIFDGDFHRAMPFEFYHKNEVDPVRGTIDYWVASASGPRPYRSGVAARIVFRMKREAGAAVMWFEGLDPYSGRLVSDVRARGRSLLGNNHGRPADALHGVSILVGPGMN